MQYVCSYAYVRMHVCMRYATCPAITNMYIHLVNIYMYIYPYTYIHIYIHIMHIPQALLGVKFIPLLGPDYKDMWLLIGRAPALGSCGRGTDALAAMFRAYFCRDAPLAVRRIRRHF